VRNVAAAPLLGGLGLVGAVWVATPAAAQGGGRFAVLAFENTGSYGQDKETFDALELGVAAMLARALDRHPGAEVIPSPQLTEALQGLDLRPNRQVDAASASQLGKGVGAGYVVTGGFVDFYGKFRINARLVDARTGEIVKVVSNDDPKVQDRAQLAAIIQLVAERLTTAAGLPPYPSGSAAPLVPIEAITAFSRGLLHESQGDPERAGEFYQAALTTSPKFEEARKSLARVRGG
jgi:TolB-like protein